MGIGRMAVKSTDATVEVVSAESAVQSRRERGRAGAEGLAQRARCSRRAEQFVARVVFCDLSATWERLYGSQCTLVVVELASGKTITIGGGPSKVVAELSENDTHRSCVVDPPARICIE